MISEYFSNKRERINIIIWENKNIISRILITLSLIVSIVALLSIIFYHGYAVSDKTQYWSKVILQISFVFYVIKYITSLLLNFQIRQYLKRTWFEGIILLFLIINGILTFYYKYSIINSLSDFFNLPSLSKYSIVIIQLYFLIIIFIELSKASKYLSRLNIGSSALMLLSFVFLITTGSLLLCMPEMTTNGIRYIDALFTSTSACCVTGLVSVDTATCFTLKGKIIIMMLIQFGGINIISFATFFATFSSNSAGLKYQSILKDMVSADKLSSTRNILREIIFFSFGIELIGALLMFAYWSSTGFFDNSNQAAFYSIFHSVSAFNNAGFALWTNNIYEITVRHSYFIQTVIMFLIFFGGLGFIAMQDIFDPSRIAMRRKRKWIKLQVGTRVALNTSIALIIIGAIFFFFLEADKSIARENFISRIFASFFQSVSSRTAGFNSVDFSLVGQPMLIVLIVLMFIGASPGSTGGGIKTTTFYVLFRTAIATLTGKKQIEIKKHSISFSLIDQAYAIVLFSISLIFISTFLLTITESDVDFIKLLFEEVSAFGTVGLSTGITPDLSDAGKTILICTMYIGRVGTLTLGFALSRKVLSNNFRYAKANIMIG